MNILSNDTFIKFSKRLSKVSICPKTISPQKFFQFWKFFSDNFATTSFEKLHSSTHANIRSKLNQYVNMIRLNIQLLYFPSVDLRTLMKKLFQSIFYFSNQKSFSIFGNPNDMIHQPKFCMSSCPIFNHVNENLIRSLSMQKPPALQRELYKGKNSSPGLKARGILFTFYKKEPFHLYFYSKFCVYLPIQNPISFSTHVFFYCASSCSLLFK